MDEQCRAAKGPTAPRLEPLLGVRTGAQAHQDRRRARSDQTAAGRAHALRRARLAKEPLRPRQRFSRIARHTSVTAPCSLSCRRARVARSATQRSPRGAKSRPGPPLRRSLIEHKSASFRRASSGWGCPKRVRVPRSVQYPRRSLGRSSVSFPLRPPVAKSRPSSGRSRSTAPGPGWLSQASPTS